MLKKWFFSLIITVPLLVSANPLPGTVFPAISEVQWIDSLEWSVELSSYAFLKYDVSLPCTTDSVKLYLFSSKTTYSTLLQFNSEGLAVITRSSITGIPDNQKVIIKRNDKIFIPYIGVHENPPYTSIDKYADNGWICDIGSLKKSGNSLIGIGYQEFIESSRSSIGTKGNYTTINRLFLIDKNGIPVPNVPSYDKIIQSKKIDISIYRPNIYQHISGADGQIFFSTIIGTNGITYLYDLPENYQYDLSNFEKGNIIDTLLPAWYFSYREDFTEHTDTMIIASSLYKATVLDCKGTLCDSLTPKINGVPVGKRIGKGEYIVRLFKPSEYMIEFYRNNDSALVAACTLEYMDTRDTLTRTVTAFSTPVIPTPEKTVSSIKPRVVFSALGNLSSGIRFVFASGDPVNQASIAVYSVDGKKVATIQVPSIGSPGTYSVNWNPVDVSGNKLSPGNYVCKFQLNQKTVSSQKVSIF